MSSDEDDRKTKAKILATLSKYGDSLLEDVPYQKKKKTSKKKKAIDEGLEKEHSIQKSEKKKRRKTKRRNQNDLPNTKSEQNFDEESWSDGDEEAGDDLTSEQRHLEDLKRKLGLTSADFASNKKGKTENNKNKNEASKKRNVPEIVIFNDPAKRKQNSLQTHGETIKSRTRRDSLENDVSFDNDLQQNRRNTSVDTAPDESFDMKRAKFDVMMLGIKGLDKVNQEKARMDVAVKLGAQPPKKTYVNYKQLQENKRKEKVEAHAQLLEARQSGGQISKSNIRKRRQRDKNDIGFLDGQVGEYKSGVQVLRKDDLKKLTSPQGSDGRGRYSRGRGGRR